MMMSLARSATSASPSAGHSHLKVSWMSACGSTFRGSAMGASMPHAAPKRMSAMVAATSALLWTENVVGNSLPRCPLRSSSDGFAIKRGTSTSSVYGMWTSGSRLLFAMTRCPRVLPGSAFSNRTLTNCVAPAGSVIAGIGWPRSVGGS
eukprot:SAG22_NODE_891_length_6647_cov_30.391723_2_plen_149_part_00